MNSKVDNPRLTRLWRKLSLSSWLAVLTLLAFRPGSAAAKPADDGSKSQLVLSSEMQAAAFPAAKGVAPGPKKEFLEAQCKGKLAAGESPAACKLAKVAAIPASGGNSSVQPSSAPQPVSTQPASSLMAMSLQTSCPPFDPPVWADTTEIKTRSVVTDTFSIAQASDLAVQTSNLVVGAGCSWADTVAWLVRCTDWTCTGGQIVAVNDDISGWGPSLAEYSAAPPGTYRWAVSGFSTITCGTASVDVRVAGQSVATRTAVHFGGLITKRIVAEGDSLLVGKNPVGASMPGSPANFEYHDSELFAFGTDELSCGSGACGPFAYRDDTSWTASLVRLSRVDIPADWPSGASTFVAVGVWDESALPSTPITMRARLLHVRKHVTQGGQWPCDQQLDNDGDGLTWEIEQAVRSCDKTSDFTSGLVDGEGIGVNRWGCEQFGNRVNTYINEQVDTLNLCPATVAGGLGAGDKRCWQLYDSDNDGLRDDQEVFAAALACAAEPVGPYFDHPVCNPIHLWAPMSCPSGQWCMSEALSARGDPTPSRHDVIVEMDPWQCSASGCSVWHVASAGHHVAETQMSTLEDVWTDEPLTCWDGSVPSSLGACPNSPPNDLPWRVKFQARNLAPMAMPDDTVGDEVRQGDENVSYIQRFRGTGKFGGLYNYALLRHSGGGAANMLGRYANIANNSQSVHDSTKHISHEMGHVRGLDHPHRRNSAATCSPACSGVPSQTCVDCDPVKLFTCIGNLNPCVDTDTLNPMVPTLMSYHYADTLGLRPKNAAPPSATTPQFTGCAFEHLRFSKGINLTVEESSVDESMPMTWQTRKLANDLFCLGDGSNNYCALNGSIFRFNTPGPYCDASQCYVNWDRSDDDVPKDAPVPTDISNGRYNDPTSQTCSTDRLEDVDEWRRMVSIGKRSLTAQPSSRDLAVYIAPFNGAAATNFVAWESLVPVSTEAPGQYTAAELYPVNACNASSTSCKMDTCNSDSDCRSGAASACDQALHRCVCTAANAENDCHSRQCVTVQPNVQRCSTEIGAKVCSANGECLDGSACSAGSGSISTCGIWRQAEKAPEAWWQANAPRDSKVFTGPGGGQFINLSATNAESPLNTIGGSANNSVWLRFDMRWDGGVGTQTSQVLAASGAYFVHLDFGSTGGATLGVEAGGVGISYPGHASGRPIEKGRWYRVRIGYGGSPAKLYVHVQAWDLDRGWYDEMAPFLAETGCVEKQVAITLPAHGDAWFGYQGNDDSRRFNGRLDNLHLLNYLPDAPDVMPTTCEVVP